MTESANLQEVIYLKEERKSFRISFDFSKRYRVGSGVTLSWYEGTIGEGSVPQHRHSRAKL